MPRFLWFTVYTWGITLKMFNSGFQLIETWRLHDLVVSMWNYFIFHASECNSSSLLIRQYVQTSNTSDIYRYAGVYRQTAIDCVTVVARNRKHTFNVYLLMHSQRIRLCFQTKPAIIYGSIFFPINQLPLNSNKNSGSGWPRFGIVS